MVDIGEDVGGHVAFDPPGNPAIEALHSVGKLHGAVDVPPRGGGRLACEVEGEAELVGELG